MFLGEKHPSPPPSHFTSRHSYSLFVYYRAILYTCIAGSRATIPVVRSSPRFRTVCEGSWLYGAVQRNNFSVAKQRSKRFVKMCLKVVFNRGWVGWRLFRELVCLPLVTMTGKATCRVFSDLLGLNRVSSVWRNFRNRCKSRLCYVILISPAISYCDLVCYMKVTRFISVM
jgi:hypothetical protein